MTAKMMPFKIAPDSERYLELVRMAFVAGFVAVAAVVAPVAAQDLGFWQNRIGQGVAYGEPGSAVPVKPADPVAALPIASRPVAPPLRRPAATTAAPVEAPTAEPAPVEGPVGNFLSRPYDADVPLPHPDLAGMDGPGRRGTRPHPFARGEQGGGVFGLTVPLPVARAPLNTKSTISGNAVAAP